MSPTHRLLKVPARDGATHQQRTILLARARPRATLASSYVTKASPRVSSIKFNFHLTICLPHLHGCYPLNSTARGIIPPRMLPMNDCSLSPSDRSKHLTHAQSSRRFETFRSLDDDEQSSLLLHRSAMTVVAHAQFRTRPPCPWAQHRIKIVCGDPWARHVVTFSSNARAVAIVARSPLMT